MNRQYTYWFKLISDQRLGTKLYAKKTHELKKKQNWQTCNVKTRVNNCSVSVVGVRTNKKSEAAIPGSP